MLNKIETVIEERPRRGVEWSGVELVVTLTTLTHSVFITYRFDHQFCLHSFRDNFMKAVRYTEDAFDALYIYSLLY